MKDKSIELHCGKGIAHFRSRRRPVFFADLPSREFDLHTADLAVGGEVTVISRPHRFPNGKIDFLFDPTAEKPPQNPEWVWQLNRMYFWIDMSLAYLKTGDEKYARAFDSQMNQWFDTTARSCHNNGGGSAWRTLECGLRLMNSWQVAFEVFRKSPSVSDATLEKMIFSMFEQAEYAFQNRTGGNWLGMEMCGCCTLAALFPEMPESAVLWRKSKEILEHETVLQMLPDGFQYELSPDYHLCVFTCGYNLYHLAKCGGLQSTLSDEFISCLEKYADATLALMTPDFTQPRTNDCFTIPSAGVLQNITKIFPERRDLLWGATQGKDGEMPLFRSKNLPCAGFAALRSGWDEDATYLCFDYGALGKNHVHQDKLNINLYKGREELIFDDGGGEYECSVHRIYGVSAFDHNTVLVDGMGQCREAPRIPNCTEDAKFVSNEKYDYICGIYNQEFAPFYPGGMAFSKKRLAASHKREILFVRPDFFCIQDTLTTMDGNRHDYTQLWHMDTLNVKPDPIFSGAFRAMFGRKYDLLIVPLIAVDEAKISQGKLDPHPSGWYVGRNDKHLHPVSTLEMTMSEVENTLFATLLIPILPHEESPTITLKGDFATVEFHGQTSVIRLKELALKGV